MTGFNTPSGVASASKYDSDREPWKVFDRNIATLWSTDTSTAWLTYKFDVPTIVKKAFMIMVDDQKIIKCDFYGFNTDGAEPVLLKSCDFTNNSEYPVYVDFDNNTPYLYYKMQVTQAQTSAGVYLRHLQYFGYQKI